MALVALLLEKKEQSHLVRISASALDLVSKPIALKHKE